MSLALCAGRVAHADGVWTDANIVTGLDISGSIEARDMQIQIDGIAMALRAPEIVSAIEHGHYGRVGFAAFVWADDNYPVFTSWRLIASQGDALATSEAIAERLHAIVNSGIALELGSLTNVSGAIDYGGGMLRTAPFSTDRRILNIIGNGIDNVGEGPEASRDRLVAEGMTINAVALGSDRTIYDYFRRTVIGGPTAFVLQANDPEKLVEVLAQKFVTEIVLNARGTELAHAAR